MLVGCSGQLDAKDKFIGTWRTTDHGGGFLLGGVITFFSNGKASLQGLFDVNYETQDGMIIITRDDIRATYCYSFYDSQTLFITDTTQRWNATYHKIN